MDFSISKLELIATVAGRVVKLAAASNDQTELPVTGVQSVGGVAVGGAGNVGVVEVGNRSVVAPEGV